jgi:hypothetical protein
VQVRRVLIILGTRASRSCGLVKAIVNNCHRHKLHSYLYYALLNAIYGPTTPCVTRCANICPTRKADSGHLLRLLQENTGYEPLGNSVIFLARRGATPANLKKHSPCHLHNHFSVVLMGEVMQQDLIKKHFKHAKTPQYIIRVLH